jgi:hypothetical protein
MSIKKTLARIKAKKKPDESSNQLLSLITDYQEPGERKYLNTDKPNE